MELIHMLKKMKLLTRRKAQFYMAELVIAALLIVSVILILLTLQVVPIQSEDEIRRDLREQGWNALAISDEIGLLRSAVYANPILETSPEILALEEFLDMVLAPELDYKVDGQRQGSENAWNIIGGEKSIDVGSDQSIVVVSYLILGNPPAPANQSILDPVTVNLTIWYAYEI